LSKFMGSKPYISMTISEHSIDNRVRRRILLLGDIFFRFKVKHFFLLLAILFMVASLYFDFRFFSYTFFGTYQLPTYPNVSMPDSVLYSYAYLSLDCISLSIIFGLVWVHLDSRSK
jgi:hypothetical protein